MLNPIRQLERALGRENQYFANPCQLEGCRNKTREGKPYCTEHVEEHPYVAGLVEQLQQRDAEVSRVSRAGARAVDPDGLMAQEIVLQLLLYGSRTAERLSRDLQLDVEVVLAYMKALARNGYVVLGETTRGSMLATPVPVHKRAHARKDRRRLKRA